MESPRAKPLPAGRQAWLLINALVGDISRQKSGRTHPWPKAVVSCYRDERSSFFWGLCFMWQSGGFFKETKPK